MSPRNIVTMMQWFQGDWEISSIGLTAVSAWDLSADSISDSKGTVNATYVILTHATGAQRELVWERSGDEHSSGESIVVSFPYPISLAGGLLRPRIHPHCHRQCLLLCHKRVVDADATKLDDRPDHRRILHVQARQCAFRHSVRCS